MIKENIFKLDKRRFGAFCEILISRVYGLENSQTSEYDLTDGTNRIEVKFSRVLSKYNAPITNDNVAEVLGHTNAPLPRHTTEKFDANIQQVKPALFDILIYGLFYDDCVVVYQIHSHLIATLPNHSAKQHRGNVGEGQFHITNRNVKAHDIYLSKVLTYKEIYDIIYM